MLEIFVMVDQFMMSLKKIYDGWLLVPTVHLFWPTCSFIRMMPTENSGFWREIEISYPGHLPLISSPDL